MVSCSETQKINPYPFVKLDNAEPGLLASLENELFDTYYPIFEKNGLTGNGYSFEGLITEFLKKQNSKLLSKIRFDSEAGGCFMFFENDIDRENLLQEIAPIFADTVRLDSLMQTVDREMIDDW